MTAVRPIPPHCAPTSRALLLFWQLLMPSVSFIGHLAGVLVGAAWVGGYLRPLALSRPATVWLEGWAGLSSCVRLPSFMVRGCGHSCERCVSEMEGGAVRGCDGGMLCRGSAGCEEVGTGSYGKALIRGAAVLGLGDSPAVLGATAWDMTFMLQSPLTTRSPMLSPSLRTDDAWRHAALHHS